MRGMRGNSREQVIWSAKGIAERGGESLIAIPLFSSRLSTLILPVFNRKCAKQKLSNSIPIGTKVSYRVYYLPLPELPPW